MSFSEDYKKFLDAGKTERECVTAAVELLEKAGFADAGSKESLSAGDRVYRNIRNKGLVAAVIGTEPVVDGMNILGAHIDSPHIDLKPMPLYEDADMALMIQPTIMAVSKSISGRRFHWRFTESSIIVKAKRLLSVSASPRKTRYLQLTSCLCIQARNSWPARPPRPLRGRS